MRGLGAFVVALAVTAMWTIAVGEAQQQRADVALRAAIEQETVKGDLRSAIAAYGKIADSPAQSRAVRAEALVRMGACYQKLGDDRAKQTFQRIVTEFGDETAVVTRARAALRELDAPRSNGAMTVRRLGVLPQVVTSISDSGLLAANTDSKGNVVIWDVAAGHSRPVTAQQSAAGTQSDEYAAWPVLSPDGTEVAYTWCATVTPATPTTKFECDGQLRVSRIRESGIDPPRTLYRESQWTAPYAWSRDGSMIGAFSRVAPGLLSDLVVISTSDGKATRLDRFPRNDQGVIATAQRVAFSPDGKYVAASVLLPVNGQSDVFVYNVSSAKRVPVATTAADERLVGWTPDGNHLLYTSEARGAYDLYEIGFAGGAVQGPPTVLRSDLGTGDPLMMSSTGALYYSMDSRSAWTVRFATLDFSTGVLTPVADATRSVIGYAPMWTRDGALVYLSRPNVLRGARTMLNVDANGATREIVSAIVSATRVNTTADSNVLLIEGSNGIGETGLYQIDLRTAKATLLVRGARQTFVSASGRRAYFFRGEGDRHDLVERDLTSGVERTLVSYQHAAGIVEDASVSPDGNRIFYRLPDADAKPPEPKSRIIERDLSSGRERDLFAGHLGHMWLSPDGRYAVVRDDDAAGKWVAMRLISLAEAQPVRELMRLNAEDGLFFTTWSPDSRSVILQKWQSGKASSWWVPIAVAGAPRQLSQQIGTAANLSIHPDGKTVAFSVIDNVPRQFEIWSMERFLKRP